MMIDIRMLDWPHIRYLPMFTNRRRADAPTRRRADAPTRRWCDRAWLAGRAGDEGRPYLTGAITWIISIGCAINRRRP
jgi:hypothetical protein